MKKILMTAVALLCMTVTSVMFSACGSDDKSDYQAPSRDYYIHDTTQLQCVDGQEDAMLGLQKALSDIMESYQRTTVSEEELFQRTQAVVNQYDNQYISGELYLKKSTNGGSYQVIKTYTMKAASK